MKQLFIKIVGVTPKELAILHTLYEDGVSQSSKHEVASPTDRGISRRLPIIQIVSARLEKDHPTYAVEFQVNAIIDTQPVPHIQTRETNWPEKGSWELRAPADILMRIWEVLGIFPPEEQFVKVRD